MEISTKDEYTKLEIDFRKEVVQLQATFQSKLSVSRDVL
jgi:hypothetical protein